MPQLTQHRVIAAQAHAVPLPFQCFAVRSEEARHASVARAPYDRVHLIQSSIFDAAALAGLAAQGRSRLRLRLRAYNDIAHAPVTPAELATAAPAVPDLLGQIAAALRLTGVLGEDAGGYRRSVAARIDYLGACGAGFHNDVSGHWTACLFWNLALAVAEVDFVMPHAGVRLALSPGDLIVFDPTMAHGLCRPQDRGQSVPASFAAGRDAPQIFLSGVLALSDPQWAQLGSPWRPVEQHRDRAALELMAAEFDERSGAIQRPRTLADCMLPSTRYAEAAAPAQA